MPIHALCCDALSLSPCSDLIAASISVLWEVQGVDVYR
jgi:hypothetical protein